MHKPLRLAIVTVFGLLAAGSLCVGCAGNAVPQNNAVPQSYLGIFHRPELNSPDAFNLEIAQGSWRWTVCGCDYSNAASGSLTFSEGKLQLQPSPQAGYASFGAFTGTVGVTLNNDGSLSLEVLLT